MTRKFLEDAGLSKDVIDKIMAEAGRDLEGVKKENEAAKENAEKLSKQVNELTKQVDATKGLEEEIAKLKAKAKDTGDYDELQKQLESWKTKAREAGEAYKKLEVENKERIADLARTSRVKEYLGGKNFINDFTRDAITGKLADALKSDDAKGKSMDDIFKSITDGMTNVLAGDVAKPPTVAPIGNNAAPIPDMMAQIDAAMGLSNNAKA